MEPSSDLNFWAVLKTIWQLPRIHFLPWRKLSCTRSPFRLNPSVGEPINFFIVLGVPSQIHSWSRTQSLAHSPLLLSLSFLPSVFTSSNRISTQLCRRFTSLFFAQRMPALSTFTRFKHIPLAFFQSPHTAVLQARGERDRPAVCATTETVFQPRQGDWSSGEKCFGSFSSSVTSTSNDLSEASVKQEYNGYFGQTSTDSWKVVGRRAY